MEDKPSEQTTAPQQTLGRGKTLVWLILSLVIPPVGLILGIWLIVRSRKFHQKQLANLGLIAIIIALVGAAAYGTYYKYEYKSGDPIGPIVATAEDYPQTELILCLDGDKTITVTKGKPYEIQTSNDSVKGSLSLTLAYHLIDKAGGEFEVGPPPSEKHKISIGECGQQ